MRELSTPCTLITDQNSVKCLQYFFLRSKFKLVHGLRRPSAILSQTFREYFRCDNFKNSNLTKLICVASTRLHLHFGWEKMFNFQFVVCFDSRSVALSIAVIICQFDSRWNSYETKSVLSHKYSHKSKVKLHFLLATLGFFFLFDYDFPFSFLFACFARLIENSPANISIIVRNSMSDKMTTHTDTHTEHELRGMCAVFFRVAFIERQQFNYRRWRWDIAYLLLANFSRIATRSTVVHSNAKDGIQTAFLNVDC